MKKAILINGTRKNGIKQYVNISDDMQLAHSEFKSLLKVDRYDLFMTFENGDHVFSGNSGWFLVVNDNGDVRSTIEEAHTLIQKKSFDMLILEMYNFSF